MSHFIDWATFYPVAYSTSEKRVGTWINGKPIYRRTYDTGALPTSPGVKTMPHGITNIDRTLFMSAVAFLNGSDAYPIPTLSSTSGNVIAGMSVTATDIRYATAVSVNFSESYATLYYTKTTD